MSSYSAGSTGSETIFVELFKALSESEDRLQVLSDFIQRFPDRESEIRELAGLNLVLDNSQETSPPDSLPAQLGEFRIGRLIKMGGMGEIYEAFHDRLGRRVALKIVRRGWTTSYARERFAREQYVLAKLHHSNIVPIQTAGEEGPIQFFTMPFIGGSALNHVIDAVANISSSSSSTRTPTLPEVVAQDLEQSETERSKSTSLLSQTSAENPEIGLVNPRARLKLSRCYFESVARTMSDIGDAIEYAHRAGVLHRDLKPANVMIESSGHCWVIDFGLAARLATSESDSAVARIGGTLFGSLTKELGGGTYNYMAPERWQGKAADERSDVFSMGAMLYELLALRQAYRGVLSTEIKYKILHGIRNPASRFVEQVPEELAAIADKAMQVDASARYQTAAEFADDIRRWLRFEPVSARPTMVWKRLWLWTRRKPAIAAAIAFALVASICTGMLVIDSYKNQAQVANAENRNSAIRLQRDRLQQELLGERVIGWSENGWDKIRRLVAEDSGGEIKSLAAATRLGVDAKVRNQWDYSPSYLTYNPAGTKFLMVRNVLHDGKGLQGAAYGQLCDVVTHQLQSISKPPHDRFGPITFRNDIPVQLVWSRKEPHAIFLWNLDAQESVGRLECPFPLDDAPLSWSINTSGVIASAAVKHDSAVQLLVWESSTSNILAKIQTNASAIELSPDGKLVAAACPKGVIEVWSVASGELLAKFKENHADTLCFAWTKDRIRQLDSTETGWLLAAGAYGGDITVWDVEKKTVRSRCIGSCFEVFSLAFSPDGMTLASVGRANPMLWNVATGELLLRLEFENTMTSVAYSPSGDSLAVGSRPAWGSPGRTTVYEIQETRGQQVLRGLRSRVTQVRISSNNRYVVALSDNWQMAVWDLRLHRLLHVFQVPIGVYAESAGLAIEASGRRIAVVSGSAARVWDTESGEILKSVDLHPGFLDSVVFQDANTLVSARQESVDPGFPPVGLNADPDQTPRVCRVRNLLAPQPQKPFLTIPDFKRSAASINVTPSGKHLLIEGYYEAGDVPQHRVIKLFDLPLGTERWKTESDAHGAIAHRIHAIDTSGRLVALLDEKMSGRQMLIDLESRAVIRQVERTLKGLGPSASLNLMSWSDPEVHGKSLLAIVEGANDRELLRLGLIKQPSDGVAISADERYFVYGCSDGSVVVTDLWSIHAKLAEVDLN